MDFLDERGLSCPIPVIDAKKALSQMKNGEILTVKVEDRTKVENISRMAESSGHQVKVNNISNDEFDVVITVGDHVEVEEETCKCEGENMKDNTVVVIASNKMGCGDETLGKNLLKAFIFALTKQENLPSTILFYNSGAYVTTEGSESIDDLKALESQGVKIFTCGTCLDFYKLKEKLIVGSVTNMYDIVKIMEDASLIIRP